MESLRQRNRRDGPSSHTLILQGQILSVRFSLAYQQHTLFTPLYVWYTWILKPVRPPWKQWVHTWIKKATWSPWDTVLGLWASLCLYQTRPLVTGVYSRGEYPHIVPSCRGSFQIFHIPLWPWLGALPSSASPTRIRAVPFAPPSRCHQDPFPAPASFIVRRVHHPRQLFHQIHHQSLANEAWQTHSHLMLAVVPDDSSDTDVTVPQQSRYINLVTHMPVSIFQFSPFSTAPPEITSCGCYFFQPAG